jgi:serine-type D-Ala-D-Ala carboxypeptidase (penicillin-binding protein 5/6)
LAATPNEEKVEFSYGGQPALSNPDFFSKVKKQFIEEKTSFIEADLSSMILRVYKAGEMALEVPIDSKGREGSWWETPAGLYKVGSKEERHFSGIGHVWMPWSMNFQGNFFIHGRTYYPDGTPTAKEFTGGCIRLLTEDAEKVYNLVEVGTPVLVFEHSFAQDAFTYEINAGPALSASSYLSADIHNNHVFASKEVTTQVPIASLTKLMTALVATEYINLDAKATVPAEAIVYTSKPRLVAGAEHSVYQLLFPLLRESSNEAAETIARYYGRDRFIKRMNDKAVSIGMTHTTFADPSGASTGNISTAEDLFMLAKYIYNNRSFVFNITSGKITNSVYGENEFENLGNFNDYIANAHFVGGKNGKTTAAQETNLSVFEFPVDNTSRPIVSIVLGSPDARGEGQRLLDYMYNFSQ